MKTTISKKTKLMDTTMTGREILRMSYRFDDKVDLVIDFKYDFKKFQGVEWTIYSDGKFVRSGIEIHPIGFLYELKGECIKITKCSQLQDHKE